MDPFGTDVLVEILRLLPPNSRRLSRLVCRRWRHLVDMHTSRAKTLLVASDRSASVLGDRKPPRKVVAASPKPGTTTTWSVIGSCNGLICLCDDSSTTPAGAIALANPVTGETLLLPPRPGGGAVETIAPRSTSSTRAWQWHHTYGFAHDQMNGRYKVVHIPCRFNGRVVYTLQVFTLGEAAWRGVPMPPELRGAMCRFDAGVVGVDGAVYWVAEGTDNTIVSFDLRDERVTTAAPLPLEARQAQAGASKIHLVDVRGRLGMAIFSDVRRGAAAMVSRTDVWVLESARGRERQTWALRYSVDNGKAAVWGWLATKELMLPHFAHGDGLVLCTDDRDLAVYAPRTSPDGDGVLRVGEQDVGDVIARECHVRHAFAHVETKEPLSIYKVW